MKVLIVDDDADSRQMLELFLSSQGNEILCAIDGSQGLKLLEADPEISLLVTDWMMPAMDGLELCRLARQLVRPRYLPILLLTSRDKKQDLIEGLNAGADAFVSKPVDFTELEAYLRVTRRILDLEAKLASQLQALTLARDELQQALHLIEQIARLDELTRLPNRRTVLERLEQDMTRAQRYATSLSVFVLDIDHFKLVNDHYGHQAGDVVLRDCAALLMRELRESDLAGRLGGEEFLGLLPETALEGAVALANRFRELVGGMVFQIPGGRTLRITVSIGVAQLHQSGETLVSLLARADNALYDAKKAGRNRVRSR